MKKRHLGKRSVASLQKPVNIVTSWVSCVKAIVTSFTSRDRGQIILGLETSDAEACNNVFCIVPLASKDTVCLQRHPLGIVVLC